MVKMDAMSAEPNQDISQLATSQDDEIERKARVESVWQQMNKGVSEKTLKSILNKQTSNCKRISQKPPSQSWRTVLGLGLKKTTISLNQGAQECHPSVTQNGTNDEAKKLAAAALLAVKDYTPATLGRGKVEVTEVRDFAGEAIEVKKLVDAGRNEFCDKGKSPVGPTSAVDAVLEQIRKKPKLSVLDKTKKDWGEFKEENKGMEDELDAYKKSSNQYLDKVSFLQRADYREFERERDARLAMQSKRKGDMREDF